MQDFTGRYILRGDASRGMAGNRPSQLWRNFCGEAVYRRVMSDLAARGCQPQVLAL
jgi:hypothetical protein